MAFDVEALRAEFPILQRPLNGKVLHYLDNGATSQIPQAVIDAVERSEYLEMTRPMGAMYAFPGMREPVRAAFDDQAFALELLEKKHVLVAPGSSFNVPYRHHFRMTTLPLPDVIQDVFGRIEQVLDSMDLA